MKDDLAGGPADTAPKEATPRDGPDVLEASGARDGSEVEGGGQRRAPRARAIGIGGASRRFAPGKSVLAITTPATGDVVDPVDVRRIGGDG